jgi:hypothetical protein
MLHIPDYKGNANQNLIKMPPHSRQNSYHLSTSNNKCWLRCKGKGALVHGCWESKLVQLLWKTICRFLKNLKLEL